MDFINKIKYQNSKLKSDIYIRYVVAELRNEKLPEIKLDEKLIFNLTLPLHFGRFLSECNTILEECPTIKQSDFDELNVEYLITLIYTAVCCEDSMLESESVPIQGVILFLKINSDKYVDIVKIDKVIFDSMFEKVIEVCRHRAFTDYKISTSLMLIWNKFLATNKNPIDVEKIIDFFLVILVHSNISTINSLDLEYQVEISLTKSIFICLKTIIEENKIKIITITCLKLIDTISNNNNDVLMGNVLYFFKSVLQKFCNEKWYFPLLFIILKQLKNKEVFVRIINQLPVEKHENVTNILINNYIQAVDKNDIEMYLTVMNLVVKLPYQDIPDDRRQKLVRRILTETYLRGSHKSHTIREHIMELFINWSQMKDINVRHHMQLMFHCGNKIHFAQLFEILLKSVDLAWKMPSYNVTFIIFTCRMFILNRNFITQYKMRVLEILCHKSTAHCLKPCVPVIMELIKHFSLAPHPILKPLLTLILTNALSATTASNYYIKELFDLLSNCMVATSDSEIEFSVCNTILSDDFNCLELFKAIQIHNFVRPEHIQVILQEKILKYTCSWKLLTILLENIDYTNFPPYMEHYFAKIKLASFFACPEAIYMLQVLTKIFMAKIKNNLITVEDSRLANMIDHSLSNHVRDLTVPAKQIGDALILLLTLNKITHVTLNWVNYFFKDILSVILERLNQCMDEYNRFPLARHMIYLEQMLLLLDVSVEEDSINKLMSIMRVERQLFITHDHIYAGIVSFTGKICLKYNTRLNDVIPLIQHAMLHGPAPVKLMAISTLYDILNLHLNYYDPLYSGLLRLIKSENIDVRNMAVKMLIKLVNDNHIRLTCNDFITLMLVLIDRNYKLCLYFIDVFENDYIHRNQHTVSKYFINLLFYLNKYKDSVTHTVTLEDNIRHQDFTYERRIVIYKFLFCNLERSNQLQILNALNTDFLTLYYDGRISVTMNTLNILRDILTLICFNATQYVSDIDISNIDEFYKALFGDMKRDFFTRKRFAETSEMDFDKIIEGLLLSVLKLVYKIEKSNISMLPQFFCTIGLVTRAFYDKVVHMVHDNSKLKDLYYELENCYTKYKEMIKSEPLDVLSYCEKQEWRLYLGYYIWHSQM